MSLFPEKVGGKYAAVLSVNTDIPPTKIAVAYFDREEQMWEPSYWDGWYSLLDDHIIHYKGHQKTKLKQCPPIKTEYGWLLIYSYIQNYFSPPAVFGIEAVLLDINNPQRIIGALISITRTAEEYEKYGKVPNIVFPTGAMVKDDTLYIYYGRQIRPVLLLCVNLKPSCLKCFEARIRQVRLTRFSGNPIIKPDRN